MINSPIDKLEKNEFYKLLISAALEKLGQFEADRDAQYSLMSENNLKFYLENQKKLIQHWRSFIDFLKKNINQKSNKVINGSLVQISANNLVQWICIFKFHSTLIIQGETVQIDDGTFGRCSGSILNATVGNTIKLLGDERGITDLNIQILRIL